MDAQAERRMDRMDDVATPLRRRAQSPAPATPQLVSQKKVPRAVVPERPNSEVDRNLEKNRRTGSGQRFGLVAGVAMLAFACFRLLWPALSRGIVKPGLTEEHQESNMTSLATVEREPQTGPSYPQLINRALDCPNIRADVLDVLAGAPYEFSDAAEEQGFYRLPRLAAAAAARDEAIDSQAEEDFRKAVLQLLITGGGWPDFKQRLRHVLEGRCQAKNACAEGPKPLELEVDPRFTSPRACSSGAVHQALLGLGEMTRIPLFRARADLYRSEGPSVVLSNASITQSRDCFAFRGANSSLALRLADHGLNGVRARQLVIEQPARWAALRPRSAPRRFAVFGLPGSVSSKAGETAYTEHMGSFEYAAAGPAAQAFDLPPALVKGLRLVFAGPEWGENYVCLYRVKVFEESGTVCSGHRTAAVLPRLRAAAD